MAKYTYLTPDAFWLVPAPVNLNPLECMFIEYVVAVSAAAVSAHIPGKAATLIGDLDVS